MLTSVTGARRDSTGLVGDPADLLQRLVCFVASALDVRFAFVASHAAPGDAEAKGTVAVWLARDYGLRFAFGRTEAGDLFETETPSYEEVLRRIWPADLDLVGLAAVAGPPLPLRDAEGRLLGHLAVLNPGPAHRLSEGEHLKSLARVAAGELQRWAARH